MIKRENEITSVWFHKCSIIVLFVELQVIKSHTNSNTSAAFEGILCLKSWKFPCGLIHMLDLNKVTCQMATGCSERLWSQNRGRFPVNMNYSVAKPSRLHLRMGVRCAMSYYAIHLKSAILPKTVYDSKKQVIQNFHQLLTFCSEWVPSKWESKQLIKEHHNNPQHHSSPPVNILNLKSACLE